jgi:signal transduction histidine kinase
VVDQYVKYSLKIEDSGVGIAEENLDKLFLNFGKLGEHDHMNSAGTGLGLSICKQLIEQMGGEVQVTSKIGVGTTFAIIITTKSRVEKGTDQYDSPGYRSNM